MVDSRAKIFANPGQPKNQKILILRSNPVAPDPRVEKIARALSQDGYIVSILCWDRSAALRTVDSFETIPIIRLPIKAAYGNGLGNLPALLRWQMGLLGWLIRNRGSFDILHACDFDTILPALFCKTLWRKQVVYDIFDFYADHLRRTPALIKKAIRALDFQAINRADGVIVVDDARRQQIDGSHPKSLISVYNTPEDEAPNLSLTAPSPLGPQSGELVITYVGLLQVERGIYEMINVLKTHPNWTLHLAGFGGDEAQIVELIKDLPNIQWYGRVGYQKTLELTCAADVLFATYDPAIPNHRYSSPNKVFEGMMLGKPIIVARDTNMDRIIEDADCGVVVTYGSEADLEAALTHLADDPEFRLRLGANGRRSYEAVYSWEKMKGRLLALYHQLTLS